jgi:hypothetical protein
LGDDGREREVGGLTARDQALRSLLGLIDGGWLIGVMVFGTDQCCLHDPDGFNEVNCPSTSYGLCDTMHDPHSVGSDCNRAERFLMRPHDLLMVPEVFEGIRDE